MSARIAFLASLLARLSIAGGDPPPQPVEQDPIPSSVYLPLVTFSPEDAIDRGRPGPLCPYPESSDGTD